MSLWTAALATIFALVAASATAEPLRDQDEEDALASCRRPLGMEHGHIADDAISASSSFDFKSVGPHNARVRQDTSGGAWCPKRPVGPGVREWLQVDLGGDFVVTRVGTQGRYGQGRGQEFAERFRLEYWRPALGQKKDGQREWRVYRNQSGGQDLLGNSNTYLESVTDLVPPLVASSLRFVPVSAHPRTVCMRVEMYGCAFDEENSPDGYVATKGDEFSPHVFLEDVHDGTAGGGGGFGLGALTDGVGGGRVELSDRGGIAKADGWVGWKKRSAAVPVELTFRFASRRTFLAAQVAVFERADMGIQAFSRAVVSFSDDGASFGASIAVQTEKSDDKPKGTYHNVTLPLKTKEGGNVGKYVRLQLFFADKWILASEVTFTTTAPKTPAGPTDVKERENKNEASEAEKNSDKALVSAPPPPPKSSVSKMDKDESEELPQEDQSSSSSVPAKSSSPSSSQSSSSVYVGLVIGVLGVTVLLLMATIAVMLGRGRMAAAARGGANSGKVFSKSPSFHNKPATLQHGGLGGGYTVYHPAAAVATASPGPDGGTLVTPTSSSSMYAPYHEPRVFLQRSNNSCGRLCDYEEPITQQQQQLLDGRVIPAAKNRFGSTPHFNQMQQQHIMMQQQQQHYFAPNALQQPTSSFSSYALGSGRTQQQQRRQRQQQQPLMLSSENFYAATDIFTQQQPQKQEEPCDEDNVLFPLALDPSHPTTLVDEPAFARANAAAAAAALDRIPRFPRHRLRLLEKLGEGRFGMLHLCEADGLESRPAQAVEAETPQPHSTVVVRSLWKGSGDKARREFLSCAARLFRASSCLTDDGDGDGGDASSSASPSPHVCALLAVCARDEPLCILSEAHRDMRDLRDFLRGRTLCEHDEEEEDDDEEEEGHYSNLLREDEGGARGADKDTISVLHLLDVARQVSSGLAHLADRGIIHRDVAARNVLVSDRAAGPPLAKLTDTAVFQSAHAADYHSVREGGRQLLLPLRWVPWEVYIMRDWSLKSDAFSFGVLLWEMATLCAERPFHGMTDMQVEENLTHHYHSDGFHLTPEDASAAAATGTAASTLFSHLQQRLWRREPRERPAMKEVVQEIKDLSLLRTGDRNRVIMF